jgi:small-conductance mechanosensitive channel
LRGFEPVRRMRASIWLAAVMGGLYLIVSGSGLPYESALLQIITAAGIMLGANALLQAFDMFLWDFLIERRRQAAVPRLLVDLFNFVVLAVVALAVLNRVFGVDLGALVVTSTVVSAVIGLALQDMLGNVAAGLALQLERPFSVGDWVQVSGEEGQVMQMNWRTLTIRTRDNHHVLLPNGTIAKQPIINYSRPTPLQKIHASVSVAYSHPPGEVRESILRAIGDADGVCREPSPEVLVKSFGEYAVVYDVQFWITDYARLPQIADSVLARIWYALRRDGLTIPFPTRDVKLHTLTEDHETQVRQGMRREVFAELRSLAVFKPLADGQIEQLAQSAEIQRYTLGEALVRQGDTAQSLYTIKSGRVRVTVRNENGQVTPLATLGKGDFFGEMSLLTGEPRSASVIAESETEVVVVDKSDFAAVLASDSGIVEAVSMALEERMRNLAEQTGAGPGELAAPQPPQRAALIQRIRGFFGI